MDQKVIPLIDLPIPDLLPLQIKKFSIDSIRPQKIGPFDPQQATRKLALSNGNKVLGADFGGDKGSSRLFEVRDSKLLVLDDYTDTVQGDDGIGYAESIKKTADYAEENGLPFGVSWGGPMDGQKMLFHPKAKTFINKINAEYNGKIANISNSIKSVLNDGPAGLISGAVQAQKEFGAKNILFSINGGGLGMSVLKDNTIFATEAGHVEAVRELNTFRQTVACGVFGAEYTCIERIGANKAGIEPQWQEKTGSYMRARDIEDRYKEGDEFARDIYDHSALVVAHQIVGTAQAFNIDLTDSETAIVGHGGAYKFPYYGERIVQIIEKHLGRRPNILLAKEFTDQKSNACLDGAAIAALTLPAASAAAAETAA